MESNEIKSLWQAYDKKLEKSLVLNKKIIREIQSQKAEAKISSFLRGHVIVMILGVLWILFLAFLVYHTLHNFYFSASLGIIILFNIYAVLLYIKHINILNSINIADSITETQRKISLVHTSYRDTGRTLLLQSPFYCTFWYSSELVAHAGPLFWTINLSIVAFFTIGSIYLYRKLDPKNTKGNWTKFTDRFFGSEKLQMAASFLNEIDEFEKDELSTQD